MPCRQRFALAQQTIGAGARQPVKLRQIFTRQLDAVLFIFEAALIVAALAGFDIKLVAGDVGKIDLIRCLLYTSDAADDSWFV